MKRGFTIIELLVASALLGMLVTILTMIFNQSSIAWRAGVAGVLDLGDIRYSVGTVHEVADNAFVYNGKAHRHIGLWDSSGNLRNRACDADDLTSDKSTIQQTTTWFFNLPEATATTTLTPSKFKPKNVGAGDTSGSSKGLTGGSSSYGTYSAYTVNVKSAGPDRTLDTWDDIWSFPDDPSEW